MKNYTPVGIIMVSEHRRKTVNLFLGTITAIVASYFILKLLHIQIKI